MTDEINGDILSYEKFLELLEYDDFPFSKIGLLLINEKHHMKFTLGITLRGKTKKELIKKISEFIDTLPSEVITELIVYYWV